MNVRTKYLGELGTALQNMALIVLQMEGYRRKGYVDPKDVHQQIITRFTPMKLAA